MKEELLKKLLEWANNLETLAKEQIPEFAQEIIRWGIIESFLGCALFLSVGIACGITIRYAYKKYSRSEIFSGEGWAFLGCASGIGLLLSIVLFCVNLDYAFKAMYAPKIYLIEYVTGLLK